MKNFGDEDDLVLIAVIEWESTGNVPMKKDEKDPFILTINPCSSNHVTKLRVRASDLARLRRQVLAQSDVSELKHCDEHLKCTSAALAACLRRYGYLHPCPQSEQPCFDWEISVYDPTHKDHVQLDQKDNQLDLVQRFGKRIRIKCRQFRRSADSKESLPILAIEGHYFGSDNGSTDGVSFQNENGKNICRVRVCRKEIVVEQEENQSNTGVSVWDGAILLVKCLEYFYYSQHPEDLAHFIAERSTSLGQYDSILSLAGKNILELGAGCGLVGMAAAVVGASSVLLTDLDSCLPLMKRNVSRNDELFGHCRIACDEYDWFHQHTSSGRNGDALPCCCLQELSSLDLILVADCVWLLELVEPLLMTLSFCLNQFPNAAIIMSYQRRGLATNDALCKGLKRRFSRIEILPQLPTVPQPKTLQILLIQN